MNYLTVSFAEKDHVKSLGARWEPSAKQWFVPDGTPLEPFIRWLPRGTVIQQTTPTDQAELKGVTLSVFLRLTSMALKKAAPGEHWIRAEISQYKTLNGGHISMELAEHNEQGQLSARIQCFIWMPHASRIVDQFTQGTGGALATGLKVLVRASADLHLTSSMRLIITDIDASFTLGDIEANLKAIRQSLTKDGLINKNKRLPTPTEFLRVAIISPNAAAGLGDFKRDADVLAQHQLCQFDYFSALFQGPGAVDSLLAAIKDVKARHDKHPYDALCIIRGGGAATDLFYLNDLSLAQAICRTTIPVFSGIGHERDNTIIDEIAHTRFDTPSKVIGFIRSTIQANALAAERDYQAILLYANRITSAIERDIEAIFSSIQQSATSAVHLMDSTVDRLFVGIQPAAEQWLYRVEQGTEQSFQFIRQRGWADIALVEGEIGRYFEWMELGTLHNLETLDRNVDRLFLSIQQGAAHQLDFAKREVESMGREIIGLGPQATLKRGFAIARFEGRPVVSVEVAKHCGKLDIEFRDGVVCVVIGDAPGT